VFRPEHAVSLDEHSCVTALDTARELLRKIETVLPDEMKVW
jgi:hypothetical protein